jgi:hypothetical protein
VLHERDATALAVWVRGPQWWTAASALLTPRRPVSLRDTVLAIDDAPIAPLPLHRPTPGHPHHPRSEAPATGVAAIAQAQSAARAHAPPASFISLDAESSNNDPFVTRARRILASEVPVEEKLPRLVGLGIGFTPSGDDFVCGALLGWPALRANSKVRDALWRTLPRTTPGGSSALRLALSDLPPLAHQQIAAACNAGDLQRMVDRARHVGHSSGFDFLAGYLWGLEMQSGGQHPGFDNSPKRV